MASLWRGYMHLLETRPLITKIVTSGTLFCTGDAIAQNVDGTIRRRGYDSKRALGAAVWGGLIFAPIAHVYYNRVLSYYIPGTSTAAVLTKVAIDQTIWGVMINSAYLSYAALWNGGTTDDARSAVENKIWNVMKANWLIWPAVQIVNFKFVPEPLQVPFINVVVIGWSCYLALQGNNDIETQSDDKKTIQKSISASTR